MTRLHVLAVVSVLFLPLTFLAGIYGKSRLPAWGLVPACLSCLPACLLVPHPPCLATVNLAPACSNQLFAPSLPSLACTFPRHELW